MPRYPKQEYDDRRASSTKRGYGYRWQRAREGFLKHNPFCADCERRAIIRQAAVLDHIIPHRGNKQLFWDRKNWQSLCKLCHDSVKQRLEKSGVISGCCEDGMPTDPAHHWNN